MDSSEGFAVVSDALELYGSTLSHADVLSRCRPVEGHSADYVSDVSTEDGGETIGLGATDPDQFQIAAVALADKLSELQDMRRRLSEQRVFLSELGLKAGVSQELPFACLDSSLKLAEQAKEYVDSNSPKIFAELLGMHAEVHIRGDQELEDVFEDPRPWQGLGPPSEWLKQFARLADQGKRIVEERAHEQYENGPLAPNRWVWDGTVCDQNSDQQYGKCWTISGTPVGAVTLGISRSRCTLTATTAWRGRLSRRRGGMRTSFSGKLAFRSRSGSTRPTNGFGSKNRMRTFELLVQS